MMPRPMLVMNRLDAERVQRLIDTCDARNRSIAEILQAELLRAEIYDPEEMPADVISMNSRVRFTELTYGNAITRTLVFPHALAETPDGLSILAPVGAALLGLRVGDTIDWLLPDGRPTRLRVDAILWQPEAAKQYHR
ncbi:nucleoside diphosphate kinase regulator [Modicisalibacter xianhensis]|nr:nucleoside diphosphate kinase regulator [Halomonas xianhensis]